MMDEIINKMDESNQMGFIVKFANSKGAQIAKAWYKDEKSAKEALAAIRKNGGNGIISRGRMNEDAPANATGTAVAGTGDDSSTGVVKKKKELQKKLMTRMGIKEAIDKAIPDLEYPKDEIRERTDQLKELASQSEEFKLKFTDPANKKKFHIVYRSKGEAEAKMAQLKRDGVKEIEIVQEDLDAQPQDKDVKKVKGTQPKKYYKKLDKDTKKKRAAFFKKKAGTYKPSDDDDDYKAAPGDEKAKTKPSTFTKKFKKMYGDSYGYTAMHMKPIGKLNPLRRKDESK